MQDDKEIIEPLDDENAKIVRFIQAFDAEDLDHIETIDVMSINTENQGPEIIPPPF